MDDVLDIENTNGKGVCGHKLVDIGQPGREDGSSG